MDWQRYEDQWPNREASTFVKASGFRWHVQQMGDGPSVLMLHGTGASTHSWRRLAPLLAQKFQVFAPDLPGHAFTEHPSSLGLTLPLMARAVGDLTKTLKIDPNIVIGHSAGAAVLVQMCLDGLIAPKVVVGLNGAFLPFRGLAGQIFSPLSKLLFVNPFVPEIFSRLADPMAVGRLVRNTGSHLQEEDLYYYGLLLRSPDHARGALAMMANWDLQTLKKKLPQLSTNLHLIVGGNDKAIRPDDAFVVQGMVGDCDVTLLPGLGHLAHEEEPEKVANLIVTIADKLRIS